MYLKKLLIVATAALLAVSFVGCDFPGTKKEESKTEESKDKEEKKDDSDKKDDEKKDDEKKDDEKKDDEKGYTEEDGVIENKYYKIKLVDGWKLYEQGSNNSVALEIAGNGYGIYLFPNTTSTPKDAAKFQSKPFKDKSIKVKDITVAGKKGAYFECSLGTYLYLPATKGCSSYKISPKVDIKKNKDIQKQIEQIELKF